MIVSNIEMNINEIIFLEIPLSEYRTEITPINMALSVINAFHNECWIPKYRSIIFSWYSKSVVTYIAPLFNANASHKRLQWSAAELQSGLLRLFGVF